MRGKATTSVYRNRNLVLALLMTACISVMAVHLALANDGSSMDMSHDHMHHRHDEAFAKVPEKARVRRNPMANDPDAMTAGKKLFGQHCAECHGAAAEGSHRAPNLHADEVQDATPGAIFWILSNGIVRHGMPDWSKLPEAQRWQITAYIKSLQPASNAESAGTQNHAASEAMKP